MKALRFTLLHKSYNLDYIIESLSGKWRITEDKLQTV